MNPEHAELLQRLSAFNIDAPDAKFSFSSRLAKENQWSPRYARRVIEEYKKFTFLAVAAGHPVSPSEDVDQAWHLHLTYSHNYWRVFCPDVLQMPFHHFPTKGGADEHTKFNDWYSRTLESYERFFGEPPPEDIWPPLATRLRTRQHFVRVDRSSHWIIPKPRWRIHPAPAQAAGLMALVLCCSGAMFANGMNPLDWRGPEFLLFFTGLLAAGFGLAAWLRYHLRVPVRDFALPELNLSPYELAYLNGGRILAVNTAIAKLVREDVLAIDPATGRLVPGTQVLGPLDDLERVICAAAARSSGEKISEVRLAAKTMVGEISNRLKTAGVVVSDGQAVKAIALPLMVAFAPLVLGMIKIYLGFMRDRPVSILVILCTAGLALGLFAFARRPLRSRLGDAVLESFQSKHEALRTSIAAATGDPSLFATGVGLFGLAALDNTPWHGLQKDLRPPANTSSGCGGSGGCGGSCGGGCGGGGCGGCGGS